MNRTILLSVLVVFSLAFLSCCKPDENGDKNNGVKHPVNNGKENDNENNEPIVLKWDNPWESTNIGDIAVYKIDAGEETWQFVSENNVEMVVKTIPGDDMLGIPPSENKITLEEILNVSESRWWETERGKDTDFSIEMTLSEMKINCTKINIGNREYTVSKDLPFDGVVELKIDGKTVRKLISFKKSKGGK